METQEKFESPWVAIIAMDGDEYDELREQFHRDGCWDVDELIEHLRQWDDGSESEHSPYVPPTDGESSFYRDPEAVKFPWGASDTTHWDGTYTLAINDGLSHVALYRRVQQPWDYPKFLSVVKDIIDERGADAAYTDYDSTGACRYMNERGPSCLIGRAFERYGVPLSPIAEGQTALDWLSQVYPSGGAGFHEIDAIQSDQDAEIPYGLVWQNHLERVKAGRVA